MHLVSNVIGTLRRDCDAIDLIRGVFPGGTITGCPKVRCLEIIEELEPVKRNLFYGSCGYLDWRGNLDLNILIPTLLCAPKSDGTTGGAVWKWVRGLLLIAIRTGNGRSRCIKLKLNLML
jgi:para-aminobenzoate synthetase component 1